MDAKELDNLIYRYAFSRLSDLMEYIKDIQEELESLYLDLEDLSEHIPDEELRSLMETRLKRPMTCPPVHHKKNS